MLFWPYSATLQMPSNEPDLTNVASEITMRLHVMERIFPSFYLLDFLCQIPFEKIAISVAVHPFYSVLNGNERLLANRLNIRFNFRLVKLVEWLQYERDENVQTILIFYSI